MKKILLQKINNLNMSQIDKIESIIDALIAGTSNTYNSNSDIATEGFICEISDRLILHHQASLIPLTKDKFEYAMVDALNASGNIATKNPNGIPGADIIVNGSPWSLKTQADKNIKVNLIHISKFMELGKGSWNNSEDMLALRNRMYEHMNKYDRIFTLRCFTENTATNDRIYKYELVEIPKNLLYKSKLFDIEIQNSSRQTPKPAKCFVYEGQNLLYELYFDGGAERKLQIRKINKDNCIVHATWSLRVHNTE